MPTPEPGDGGSGGPGGPAGTVLGGRYRLENVAGRGGMAEVWRARDIVLDRVVAVKWFTPGAGDAAAPARQQAEMKLLAGFNHPGLVTVYDAGSERTPMGDRPYVVMEYVDGPTLAAKLSAGSLPPSAITAIGSTVAAALAYVHARGVVHRDVKPGNILLEGGDDAGPTTVKLADFGIARLVDDARVTKTGMTVGTASYLSPEQVRGETITAKSDVYSLALVLLEAFTGTVEFAGSPVEAAVARLNRDPVIPGRVGPLWGPLLASMTARDPALRPTAQEVAERLAGAPGATGPATATTSLIPPAAGTSATAYLPPTGGVPRPVVVGSPVGASAGMPPVRPMVDDDPPPPPRAPRPIWPWVVAVLAVVVVGAIVAFAVGAGGDGDSTDQPTTPAVSTSATATPSTSAPSTEATTPPTTSEPTTEPTTPPATETVTESVTPTSEVPTSTEPTTPPTTDDGGTSTAPTSTDTASAGQAGQGGGAGLGPTVPASGGPTG